MPILSRCGSCNTKFRVKDSVAGKKVRCPKCGEAFRVPMPDSTTRKKDNPVPLTPPTVLPVAPLEEEIIVAEAIEPTVAVDPTTSPVPQAPIANAVPQSQPPSSAPSASPALPQATPLAQPLPASDLPVAQPLGSALPQATPIRPGVPTAAPLNPASPGGINISTEPRIRRRKKTGLSTALVTMVFLASCLILIAALFIFLQSRGPQAAVLRVNIPTNLREDCAVSIDGSTEPVSLTQVPLDFAITRGKHRVSLRRIGHQKVDYDLDVKGAEIVELNPDWIPIREESPTDHSDEESSGDGDPIDNENVDMNDTI